MFTVICVYQESSVKLRKVLSLSVNVCFLRLPPRCYDNIYFAGSEQLRGAPVRTENRPTAKTGPVPHYSLGGLALITDRLGSKCRRDETKARADATIKKSRTTK